jgi:hypothetical protein
MGSPKRGKPSPAIQAKLIQEQTGRCGYCNSSLADQDIVWDHFEPFAYSYTNSRDNWVAACAKCNGKKNDLIFDSEGALEAFCLSVIKSHGSLAEGWPDGSTTAFRHLLEVSHG